MKRTASIIGCAAPQRQRKRSDLIETKFGCVCVCVFSRFIYFLQAIIFVQLIRLVCSNWCYAGGGCLFAMEKCENIDINKSNKLIMHVSSRIFRIFCENVQNEKAKVISWRLCCDENIIIWMEVHISDIHSYQFVICAHETSPRLKCDVFDATGTHESGRNGCILFK